MRPLFILLLSLGFTLCACNPQRTAVEETPTKTSTSPVPVTATNKPSATNTPNITPTEPLVPSITTKPSPSLIIPAATICRKTPSEYGLFAHGISKDAHLDLLGKDATEKWFLVVNPGSSGGKTCWVASRNAEIIGDLVDIPYASVIQ